MKIAAYILAATPDWLEASVRSYYDLVDRIVVTYDRRGLGWNGKPLPVEACLERLRSLDHDHKMTFCPGDYSDTANPSFDNQTHQRQEALDMAGQDADWVLQFDTDEVLSCPETFRRCLIAAEAGGFSGLDFPARWLYQRIRGDWFLERCHRFWRIAASYPGPVAVRSGTQLRHARQCDVSLYRVDFRRKNTDPCRSPTKAVHEVISRHQGIVHYAWIRSPLTVQTKLANHSGLHKHSTPKEAAWAWCGRHPWLSVLRTPGLRRRWKRQFLRLSRITPPNAEAEAELRGSFDATNTTKAKPNAADPVSAETTPAVER